MSCSISRRRSACISAARRMPKRKAPLRRAPSGAHTGSGLLALAAGAAVGFPFGLRAVGEQTDGIAGSIDVGCHLVERQRRMVDVPARTDQTCLFPRHGGEDDGACGRRTASRSCSRSERSHSPRPARPRVLSAVQPGERGARRRQARNQWMVGGLLRSIQDVPSASQRGAGRPFR